MDFEDNKPDETLPRVEIVEDDPELARHMLWFIFRRTRIRNMIRRIGQRKGGYVGYTSLYKKLGLHYDPKLRGHIHREWAPEAESLHLIGDFNNWNRTSHPLRKLKNGYWQLYLPSSDHQLSMAEGSRYKVHIHTDRGAHDRISAGAQYVKQDEESQDFAGIVHTNRTKFEWTDQDFDPQTLGTPYIYECHVGMAQEKEGIGSYREFADLILPRIVKAGYTYIQLMAIMEHPYYASFGYHVSNIYAPSSRFGHPNDLKYLINKAHELGIGVILDLVHSHAVKNVAEGLNFFDGSNNCYFDTMLIGDHPDWDSKTYDFVETTVLRYLLSNLRYWLEEFHFDGFRFDGVGSMMYTDFGKKQPQSLGDYFGETMYDDTIIYLMLANHTVHTTRPGAITIAEDFSGMPGLARSIPAGGMGFDYRLGMGIPDYWIKLLKEVKDEDWNLEELWYELTNRRIKEKTIAYAESHDQAIVGDKTLAFWLMDKHMYTHMHKDDAHPVIERGMALHKMVRLITASVGGEGYMNFMGNEFGHPEWIDFPREGNDWSYQHARRQWSLADNPDLKYHFLAEFDREMIALLQKHDIPASDLAQKMKIDPEKKIMVYERGDLLFLFNFNVSKSFPDYGVYVPTRGDYRIVLNTDSKRFGGHGRIDEEMHYSTPRIMGFAKLKLYLTNRTALVLELVEAH